MSVFSVSALDRLIESDSRSVSSSETTPRMEKQKHDAVRGERRPLYVSYPYNSSTTSASPSPRPRTPSPSSFSPSPYVVNHKRRVPNGVNSSKRTSQQNGFHVSDKSSASRPSESQELLALRPEKKGSNLQDNQTSNGSNSSATQQGQNLESVVKEHSRSPQSSFTWQFQSQNGDSAPGRETSQENYSNGCSESVAEESGRGNRVGGGERIDMPCSRNHDHRGKKKVEDRLEAGTSALKPGEASSSITKNAASKACSSSESKSLTKASSSSENKIAGKATSSSEDRLAGQASSNSENNAAYHASSSSETKATCDGVISNGNMAGDAPCRADIFRASTGSSTEEWFDTFDGPLPDYGSDDDGRRVWLGDLGPSSRGELDSSIDLQLRAEIKRRIVAEEARESLQQQRDGMAQMLSSAGIFLPQSDVGDMIVTEFDKLAGVPDSGTQRLIVARYVAGAVATGAVRAEAEAALQIVLAEKSKEISRLKDKLQYYELVNHEMSHRNQESIENARQVRRRRQRRNRLVFFGLSTAICLGVGVAVAYQYAPWEYLKGLSSGSTLPEGELPNPKSLEKVVVDLRESAHIEK